jgi:hypothetical protein
VVGGVQMQRSADLGLLAETGRDRERLGVQTQRSADLGLLAETGRERERLRGASEIGQRRLCEQCAQHGRWCPRHGHYYSDEPEVDKQVAKNSKQLSASRDFVAGCAAGVCSTFVGHPFDTVKVRLQMGSAGAGVTGPVSCALRTVRREGTAGLFKGLASPMLTVPLVNAVVFGVYGHAKSTLQARHPDRPLSTVETCTAGAWAGLVNTAVVTPVELLKCRMQVAGDRPAGGRAELRALRKTRRALPPSPFNSSY